MTAEKQGALPFSMEIALAMTGSLPTLPEAESEPGISPAPHNNSGVSMHAHPKFLPPPPLFPVRHCSARGCVFPVSETGNGLCHFHDMEDETPVYFQSRQPILSVLDRAKYVFWEEGFEDDCERKRRVQTLLRRAIMRGSLARGGA